MTKRRPNHMATRRPLNPLESAFRRLAQLTAELQPNRLANDSLRQLDEIRRLLAPTIDAAVDRAHDSGYSWSEIAAALRISPQAAQQGYARRH